MWFNLKILKKKIALLLFNTGPLCIRNILHFTEVSFVNVFKIHLTHKYSTISGEKKSNNLSLIDCHSIGGKSRRDLIRVDQIGLIEMPSM